jgi:hypothetical protein
MPGTVPNAGRSNNMKNTTNSKQFVVRVSGTEFVKLRGKVLVAK